MRVLVFGATGSAGGSVLNVWLELLRPLGQLFAPFQSLYVAGEDIGLAMLQATTEGIRHRIIENPEIRAMARRAGPSISGARQ